MTIMSRFPAGFPARTALVSALVACALPLEAAAQSIGYGDVSGGADAPTAGASKEDGSGGSKASRRSRGKNGGKTRRTSIEPYIEAAQVVTAELEPGNEVLTYSVIAAGFDADIVGVNNAAARVGGMVAVAAMTLVISLVFAWAVDGTMASSAGRLAAVMGGGGFDGAVSEAEKDAFRLGFQICMGIAAVFGFAASAIAAATVPKGKATQVA